MIAAAPESLLALVRRSYTPRPSAQSKPAVELDSPEAIVRAIAWLESDRAPEAVEGSSGNPTTFRLACRVKDFGLSPAATLDVMLGHWNETKAFPPWDAGDLEAIVANAFEYGTSPPGGKTAEAEFDVVEIEEPAESAKPRRAGMHRVRFDEAVQMATTQANPALVEDVLDQHSFGVFYGPSNSGKTFLALSIAYHVAMGLPWASHAVAGGTVLYVVAEGGRGINKRLAALNAHYKPATLPPLDLVPSPVDLKSNDADVKRIVKLAREAAAEHGQPLRMIVIDTLSRALAGGDENASTDMGAFVANVDRLREATSATVVVVHHTGKNVANGARGWSGLRAAIDTEVEIGEGGVISFEKQRDLEKIPDIRFRLEVINLGHGAAGKDITSCVLHPITAAEAEFDAQIEVSPMAKDYFDTLAAMGDEPVSLGLWNAAFDDFLRSVSQPAIGDKTKQRLRSTLAEAGWIERFGKTKWRPSLTQTQE
jgi:KaiC/GvpD/RAD55 family RecA-like ATPase